MSKMVEYATNLSIRSIKRPFISSLASFSAQAAMDSKKPPHINPKASGDALETVSTMYSIIADQASTKNAGSSIPFSHTSNASSQDVCRSLLRISKGSSSEQVQWHLLKSGPSCSVQHCALWARCRLRGGRCIGSKPSFTTRYGRPKPDIRHGLAMLRRGPSLRTFAATAKSVDGRTHDLRDLVAVSNSRMNDCFIKNKVFNHRYS